MNARAARFVTVGAMGFALQMAVMAWLTIAGWPYLVATALAVEAAVLHNFFWHVQWTWADREPSRHVWKRLARFHAANGLNSVLVNVLGTALFVELAGVPPIYAGVLGVGLATIANFVAADRCVFATVVAEP